jgi:hypothetical protein
VFIFRSHQIFFVLKLKNICRTLINLLLLSVLPFSFLSSFLYSLLPSILPSSFPSFLHYLLVYIYQYWGLDLRCLILIHRCYTTRAAMPVLPSFRYFKKGTCNRQGWPGTCPHICTSSHRYVAGGLLTQPLVELESLNIYTGQGSTMNFLVSRKLGLQV